VTELIFLVEEAPEGGYTARALGQSIFTEANTLDSLRANIREVVLCHFEEGKAPDTVRLEMDAGQAIESGLADSNAGRTAPVAEVRPLLDLPQ